MTRFDQAVKRTGEVGTIERLHFPVALVKGLLGAKPGEMVVAESGEVGEVTSFSERYAEILLFTKGLVKIQTKVARMDHPVEVRMSDDFLGRHIDPLGHVSLGKREKVEDADREVVDRPAPGLGERRPVDTPFVTGVPVVDLVVPLARGQRELVIGNRKLAKSQFLEQVVLAHVRRGGACVYAAIAKPQNDTLALKKVFRHHRVTQHIAMVATNAADSAGLIYLTPYTAMALAEHLRDAGRDVLVVLDDLSIHAKYYREISLLLKRFPGRSSYPGDIFYAHARLMERAGVFESGSITCLPVAETVRGNLSEYIATNLMSMTDGHVYFDLEYYNQGRRPAINPYLSVTRVGSQTQTPLIKSISTDLSSFLVHYKKMQQLAHFGGELNEQIRRTLSIGELLTTLFYEFPDLEFPLSMSAILVATIWADMWVDVQKEKVKTTMRDLVLRYQAEPAFRDQLEALLAETTTLPQLVEKIQAQRGLFAVGVATSETQPTAEVPVEQVEKNSVSGI